MVGTRVGDVLASKYRLEELLGSGGMGHVYRAINEDVGRAVAIKVLRSEHVTNGAIVERFLREARAANLVRHPNVVDVLDVGRDGDGSPFIVQELLKGQDLAKYVGARGGKLSLAELEEYYLPVVDAVAEAHARGVVHRDIKPENVFLAEDGKRRIPKLLDFGISKIRLPNVRATEVGVMMGTPAYMSPEQIHGSHDADPRSDVWALGIMLFELVSGRTPFDALDAPALFVAIATKDAPALTDVRPDVLPALSRVTGRCLRRVASERYPSALELARDLRHVFDGTDVEPTQRLSIPPPAKVGPLHVIPDLVVPPTKISPALPPATTTISGLPPPLDDPALHRTELLGRPVPPDAPSARSPSAPELDVPLGSHRGSEPDRSALRSKSRPDGDRKPLPGVMLSGPSTAGRARPPPVGWNEAARPPPQDLSLLYALGVVGLVSIGSTAALMTFGHRPEGISLVQLVTRTSPLLNLVVQGGLAAIALVLAGRSAVAGVTKWRDLDCSGAVFRAIVAGAFFFGAIELARAAW